MDRQLDFALGVSVRVRLELELWLRLIQILFRRVRVRVSMSRVFRILLALSSRMYELSKISVAAWNIIFRPKDVDRMI